MKNQLFNKRIPTILGICLVMVGVVLTTILVNNQTNFRGKASNSEEPKNIKFTNLSESSFTITYQTDIATTGSINYGLTKELGNTELDDADRKIGNFSPKNIHSITVENLSPDTKYFLTIISGRNTYLNNGVLFEVSTAPTIASSSTSQATIKGKIVLSSGNPPNESLVYLNTDNSQLLSSIIAENGEFDFSLKSLRTSNLSSYLMLDENTILKLLAINDSLKSSAIISLNQANSIPTITLSNDYDFTNQSAPVSSRSGESFSFPNIESQSEELKPQIIVPKKDQSFMDQKPQFRGTSLPNEKVQIIIHSPQDLQAQIISDSNGNWTYRPTDSLSPGPHTITVLTRNSSGILITLMQSFTVLAAETQVATPTSTPSPTPTLVPTVIVLTPTSTPIPTSTSVAITSKNLPPPGNSSLLPLIIGSIVVTITGIALFLLTNAIL